MSDQPKILVTRKLPKPVEARLAADFNVALNMDDTQLTGDQIIELSKGYDGLLVCATEKCDAGMIEKLPDSIKILATYSVGYDHIDVAAAQKRRLMVTNTPDVLTDATADIALLLLLGAARGAYWGEQMVRQSTWGRWSPTKPLGLDITGKRLGILGMGRIGQAVAKRARGFDMEIHYHNRAPLGRDLDQGGIYHQTLDSLMAVSDFLSINCASTPQTRMSINAKTIAMMPAGAVVINTARGDIVDDEALIAALKDGKLAAAGLDVFHNEPDIDERYRQMENVFLLPHLGSATPQTRIAMGMRAVDNIENFFAGKPPRDIVTSEQHFFRKQD
jgi:glyoxylate reductase